MSLELNFKNPIFLVVGAAISFGVAYLLLGNKASGTGGGGGILPRKLGTLTILTHAQTSSTPIAGATVHITMTDGYATIDQTQTTNNLGMAVFPNIPEGGYRFVITRTGYRVWDVAKQVVFDEVNTQQQSYALSLL